MDRVEHARTAEHPSHRDSEHAGPAAAVGDAHPHAGPDAGSELCAEPQSHQLLELLDAHDRAVSYAAATDGHQDHRADVHLHADAYHAAVYSYADENGHGTADEHAAE